MKYIFGKLWKFLARTKRKSPPVGAGEEIGSHSEGTGNERLFTAQFERGFVTVAKNILPDVQERHIYIADVFTMPEERRDGVAKNMLERVEIEARTGKYEALYANVPIEHGEAPTLFGLLKKCGFKMHMGDTHSVSYRKGL